MSREDDIPHEVRLIATELILNGPVEGNMDEIVAFEEAIARAILSERTKAAEIAEGYKWDEHELQQATECGYALHEQSLSISQAIRKGGKE